MEISLNGRRMCFCIVWMRTTELLLVAFTILGRVRMVKKYKHTKNINTQKNINTRLFIFGAGFKTKEGGCCLRRPLQTDN